MGKKTNPYLQLATNLLRNTTEGYKDHSIEGTGCPSCGHGSTDVYECVDCNESVFVSRNRMTPEELRDALRKSHRRGCSIPLIQKAQHEAGLHDEDKQSEHEGD